MTKEINTITKNEILQKISGRVSELIGEGWVIVAGFTSSNIPEFHLEKDGETLKIKSEGKMREVLVKEGNETLIQAFEVSHDVYVATKEELEMIQKK